MLHAAIRPMDDDIVMPDPPGASWVAAVVPSTPAIAPDRYGARARPNILAILAILFVHILLIGALVQMRSHVLRAQEAKLTVVNLSPPPPPPAAESPPPPPSAPQVVAPPPIVQTPAPMPTVQTTPEPVPVSVPAPTMAVTPGPVAPVAAPPAPPSIVQGGDLGAQMVAGKSPRYPIESRRRREQGTVLLTLTLGLDGAVETVAVSQSSGFARLDAAARDAVKNWRWKPMIRDGQPVRVRGVVEIPFIIRTDAA
ncbi:protein TonB [Sphingobium xenophagum]|uniref:Protein TonB n=1 Tax=Sphingobium xenophagum TaxID=121428 RepID=A0ABU1X239_SPHXE|nr:TonB family protein [Sphingobium xenophagum]MDR7155648.1 protein TonB [Sphingobium xenophagum]